MTSRNSPSEFVRACATISLLLGWTLGSQAAQTQPPAAQSKTPAIALLDADVAFGGSPKAAIDSNRIFAANSTLVPLLWIAGDDSRPMAEKLTAAQLNLEWQPAAGRFPA